MKRGAAILSLLLVVSLRANAGDVRNDVRTGVHSEVRIGVLGIFHPRELVVNAAPNEALVVKAGDETFVLEAGRGTPGAQLRATANGILLEIDGHTVEASEIQAAGRNKGAAAFILAIPGKISRTYIGTLEVRAAQGELVPIAQMDLETAVAAAVQAESSPDLPFEALKAQAVVSRSYYIAGKGRHRDFDFCDLTHCQLLQAPPGPQSSAVLAAQATRGMAITYQGSPVAAMFTPSCGGRTRTPSELGMAVNGYPYFAVECDYCHRHPVKWQRRISSKDAAALNGTGEAGRLAAGRRLGWDAVPSNNYSEHEENGEVALEGEGRGHGIGLCQRGAGAMAAAGAGFREILDHYFPNTQIAIPRSVHSF